MNQLLPQQDFFMYIPEMREMEIRPLFAEKGCASAVSGEGHVVLPFVHDNWVKIPLEGQMVVYAHIWHVEE